MADRKLKKSSSSDDDGSASWSNLGDDMLFIITMRVGVFDFIALSGVCKSWRSFALSKWNKFMVSKQPMKLTIPTLLYDDRFYLEDHTRRKTKTTIPRSNGRVCIGVTCGYLIFFGNETHDFWLVNPLTRKELYFPRIGFTTEQLYSRPYCPLTFDENLILKRIRGILVFSPSMSGWVFVVSVQCSNVIAFCLAGIQARWTKFSVHCFGILDLHFFKGKIYIISTSHGLWELRLNPEPTLTLLDMTNFPMSHCRNLEFVSSCENLYVREFSGDVFEAVEADFDEMKWVNSERTIGEYEVFVSNSFKCGAAIKPDTWTHPWTRYERLNFSQSDWLPTNDMWYYPHECLNDNDSDMENGALLNTLEEYSKKTGGSVSSSFKC